MEVSLVETVINLINRVNVSIAVEALLEQTIQGLSQVFTLSFVGRTQLNVFSQVQSTKKRPQNSGHEMRNA